jgi:hypothetical protein
MLRWVFACAAAMQPPAADGAAPAIALQWDAPASCPSQQEMVERIAALQPSADRAVVVEVVEEGGRFRARVEIEGSEERWLEAPTCEAVAEAVGLVVAIGIVRGEIVEPPVAAAPVEPDVAEVPTPTTATPSSALRVGVAFDGGITWRTVPRVGPTIAGGVAVIGERWRVDLRGIGTTRTEVRLPMPADEVTAQVRSGVGEVRAAFVPRVRIVELPIGGGFDLGALRARAKGGRPAPTQTSLLLALVGTAGIAVVPLPWLAVRAEVAGVIALVRPRFGVHGEARDVVVQTPVLGLRALLGLEFRIDPRRSARR